MNESQIIIRCQLAFGDEIQIGSSTIIWKVIGFGKKLKNKLQEVFVQNTNFIEVIKTIKDDDVISLIASEEIELKFQKQINLTNKRIDNLIKDTEEESDLKKKKIIGVEKRIDKLISKLSLFHEDAMRDLLQDID